MKPFKMFFGIALGAILLLFVARVAILAFVIAAVMSIVYAVFRRLKDFITYDRFGEHYIPEYKTARIRRHKTSGIEPLFYEPISRQKRPIRNIQLIETI